MEEQESYEMPASSLPARLPPPPPPPPVPPMPKTDGLAITSLVLGIVSMVCCTLFVTGIPAAICGHKSRRKIRESGGRLEGDGLALAGLIMGYIGIGMTIFVVPLMLAMSIPAFVKAREQAQLNVCMNNLRQIESAKEKWALEEKKEQEAPVDEEAVNGYIREKPVCPKGGTYFYNAIGKDVECDVHGTIAEPEGLFSRGSAD